jgi:hypothetical protein
MAIVDVLMEIRIVCKEVPGRKSFLDYPDFTRSVCWLVRLVIDAYPCAVRPTENINVQQCSEHCQGVLGGCSHKTD